MKNLLALLLGLGFTFVALECVFLWIEPKSPPGTTYGEIIRTNRDGFRDREFTIPKPSGVYRILVLGDSFTWGEGLSVEKAIPKLLEGRLNGGKDGLVEVVNGAVPGYNTVQEAVLFRTKGLVYEPDMIIVIYNMNDVEHYPWVDLDKDDAVRRPRGPEIAAEGSDPYSVHQGFRGLVYRVEGYSAFVRFLVPRVGNLCRRMGLLDSPEFSWVEKLFRSYVDENPGWIESRRALQAIREMSRKRKALMIVAVYPLLVELDRYKGKAAHQAITAYCRSIGVDEVLDLFEIFENRDGPSFWINYADGHPNSQAHAMVTERLLPAVRRHLPASRPQPQGDK